MRVPDAASLASGLNDARIAVVASLYRHLAIQTMRWPTTQISRVGDITN